MGVNLEQSREMASNNPRKSVTINVLPPVNVGLDVGLSMSGNPPPTTSPRMEQKENAEKSVDQSAVQATVGTETEDSDDRLES